MRLRRIFLSLMVICFFSVNYGCFTIFAAGAIAGVGHYMKYTMDNIAQRTFVADLYQVTLTTLDVLKRLRIKVNTVEKGDDGASIYASANNLTIKIYLLPISDITTKVTVDAVKLTVLKDRATADEIISQIDHTLQGGTLLIGVRDDGKIAGLESDYNSLKKNDSDYFEIHLRNLLKQQFGIPFITQNLVMEFPVIEGKEICAIRIAEGSEPVYITTTDKHGNKTERFYVRSGNSSHEILSLKEITEYISSRFQLK